MLNSVGPPCTAVASPKAVWLSREAGRGLEVCGTFSRSEGSTRMDMAFSNKTANVAMNSFALQLNKNSFGLVPSEALQVPPLAPGQSFETSLRLGYFSYMHIQGDHSGCAKPPVDIKTKVPFYYEAHVLKQNFCFEVNGRFGPT